MLFKNKELEQTKELVSGLNSDVKEIMSSMSELKKEFQAAKSELREFRQSFEEIKAQQQTQTAQIGESSKKISKSADNFENEIVNFKLLSTQMQKKILDNITAEVNDYTSQLKTDVGRYNEMKTEINNISKTISSLREDIEKFREISSKIKAKDFEMERFAKELLKLDTEKLDLMRKIEQLQRLISHERRRR